MSIIDGLQASIIEIRAELIDLRDHIARLAADVQQVKQSVSPPNSPMPPKPAVATVNTSATTASRAAQVRTEAKPSGSK